MLIITIHLIGIVAATPIGSGDAEDAAARIKKSQEMLNYMNQAIDPCDDFYEFACGNFKNYHTVSDSEPVVSPMHLVSNEMDAKIMTALNSVADDAAETETDKKAKTFYRSCINAAEMENTHKEQLLSIIGEYGAMPVLEGDKWSEHDFDWLQTIGKIYHDLKLSIIFDIVIPSEYNISEYVFMDSYAPWPKSYYLESSMSKFYDKDISDYARELRISLGVEASLANQTAKELFAFEVALAQGLEDDRNVNQQPYKNSTYALHKKYLSDINLYKYLDTALGVTPRYVSLKLPYLDNVIRVMKNTPKRVVANYIFYYLFAFFTLTRSETVTLETYCLESTKVFFFKALDNMLYRRYFNEAMKEGVYALWHELTATFEDELHSARLSWIGETTREFAIEKLKAIKLIIKTYEEINFEQEYAELQLNDTNYVQNTKSILALIGRKCRDELKQPVKNLLDDYTVSYTPTYEPKRNSIGMPVSTLQPNYALGLALANAYNFGNLVASSLGHEMIHAFDDVGRLKNSEGCYVNWWDTESAREFETRTSCLRNQYKEYSMNGHKLQEIQKQSENIADNGGVRLGYAAYMRWYNKASNETREKEIMPGLNYTNGQLFFISYGQSWCWLSQPKEIEMRLVSDIHVMPKFRVIGPLSNMEEFSKEFNCPKGSPMNPETKCIIY